MSTGILTREDFEALLWDYLHRVLPEYGVPIYPMLDALGITPEQWKAFTNGERAEFRAALDVVKSETFRRVWQKEGDRR